MEVSMDVAGSRLALESYVLMKHSRPSNAILGHGGSADDFEAERTRAMEAIRHVITTGEPCLDILPRKRK